MSIDDPILVLWGKVGPRVERAIANSKTYLDGYPSGSGTLGAGGESRTERLAERHLDKGDRHGEQRRQLERAILQLAGLVDQLAPSNAATLHLATKANDVCPSGCCESCWRVGTRSPTKNPGGAMCRWCGDMARGLELDMPPVLLVEKHAQGKQVTDRDVRLATGGKHG